MKQFFTLKRLVMIGWTVLVLFSLGLAGYNQHKNGMKIAKDVLDANFKKDQAFLAWVTSHGGAYIPADESRTPPSPYMDGIKDRKVETLSGKKLILMNPADIVRELSEETTGLYGTKMNITALELLNPDNVADEWETKALKAFKRDPNLKEILEFADVDGVSNMRLIRPMEITPGCLKCHVNQESYQNTQTAGGMSVSLPMTSMDKLWMNSFKKSIYIHIVFLLIGLAFIQYISRKEQEAIDGLVYFANFDNLTDLPNRYAYNEKIEELMSDKKVENIYMLFMDLDNFKTINDTLGHSIGDLLLQSVGRRLENRIKGYELFARFGGDEFVFLFTNVQSSKVVEKIAQRIHTVFDEAFMLKGYDTHTTVSIGIASYPSPAEDQESLLRNADIAMYSAKSGGKGQYAFYNDHMNAKTKSDLRLESELHKALPNDEFFLLYQPQINLATGQIQGVEALIRWNNTQSGLISPTVFIPLAEANGLIMPIGAWVIDEACKQLELWKSTPMKNLSIAINLSSKQLLHQNLHSYIRKAITRTGINSSLLELEITESVIMENITETIEVLRDLKTLGVSIAIDDFGTGYSSLSYLKKLPIDKLKIDREFIKDIPDDQDDIAITNAIVSLAKSLGLTVVAEGPEKIEHIEFLKSVGCDIAQGYYYAKPTSAAAIEKFLH